MASLSAQQQHELALSAAYEDDTPTPVGWRRKLIPHIGKGLVPARTDVVFIAPSGEEFKSKAQLQRYLKSNKRSPSMSEFIWITDETPRRSSRSVSKRSRSPPKSAKKKKPAAGAPLQESKATKRSKQTRSKDVEGRQRDEKKHRKETPVESTSDIRVSPTWSSAKDSKKRKPLKATKEEKNVKGETQSPEVSSEAYMSENSSESQESEKREDGMGEEESTKENNEEVRRAMNGEEEAMEEPISHHHITKEEARRMETNIVVEEQEAMGEYSISHEAETKERSKSENMQVEFKHSDTGDNDADIGDQDGSKDGTTLSLLGSDFSTDGMEADSDMFESIKKESPDSTHHAEKDQSGGL